MVKVRKMWANIVWVAAKAAPGPSTRLSAAQEPGGDFSKGLTAAPQRGVQDPEGMWSIDSPQRTQEPGERISV
jgi:hypothetical protein